jgi:TolA-binding protein
MNCSLDLAKGRRRRVAGVFLLFLFTLTCHHAFGAGDTDLSTRNRIKIRKKSHLEQSAPEEGEEFNAEKFQLLQSKRRGLILDIKRFLRESSSEDQKAELNLRLGGLYMEDYYSSLAKAQTEFEEQNNDAKKKKNAPPAKFDNSEAIASLDKARGIYKDLVTRYPKHPRRDEMFYFLAVSSLDRGKAEEGMNYFRSLAEQFPGSRYANDALVQLGDFYFDANKFPQAEVYYEKIIQKKYMSLVPYATYKKAWCEYNAQRAGNALQLFKWVIDNEDAVSEGNAAPIKIKNEALKDITLPFVDLKLVDDAISFFRAHGDKVFRTGVETMSALYK